MTSTRPSLQTCRQRRPDRERTKTMRRPGATSPGEAGFNHESRNIGTLLCCGAPGSGLAKAALDIIEHHLLELGGDGRPAQGRHLVAVNEDRCRRLLARTRK